MPKTIKAISAILFMAFIAFQYLVRDASLVAYMPKGSVKHRVGDLNPLPHIVMVVVDDLGSHDLGLHGTGIHTPNIDGFVTGPSADGMYLDEYYVLPYCSSTRAALLSGMYPLRTGVHKIIGMKSTEGLPLNIETLPEMLKRARTKPAVHSSKEESLPYQNHAVGKWHVGHSSWNQTPTFRGFDSFFGYYMGRAGYFTHSAREAVDLHYDREPQCGEGCSEIIDERGNYSTHVFTREAIKIVQNHAKKFGTESDSPAPLFLYLAYQAVHCPPDVPPEYSALYEKHNFWNEERRDYAGMLTAADEGVGNLTLALKESGLWENTLIIVTTDNGGPTTVGCAQGSSNFPKRGGKCSLWEVGTTGDAILAGPALKNLLSQSTFSSPIATKAHTTTGTGGFSDVCPASTLHRFQHLFHVVDWFPTLAEWVGVVPLNQSLMDGISQAKALADGETGGPARTELFGGYVQLSNEESSTGSTWWGPSIRHLNWKLIQGFSGGPDFDNNWPTGTETIIPPGDHEYYENTSAPLSSNYLLFDLEKDPKEEENLSEVYPEVLEKMVKKLKLYKKSFTYPHNDDERCPFLGFVKAPGIGKAWCVLPSCCDVST